MHWHRSAWQIKPIAFQIKSPGVNQSGLRLLGRLLMNHPYFWLMNRLATWIKKRHRRLWNCWVGLTEMA